jgi:hypothetical protein
MPKNPVVGQRRSLLEAAGFSTLDAHRIARDPRYDASELIALLQRGFPPALALKVVDPTVGEGSAA